MFPAGITVTRLRGVAVVDSRTSKPDGSTDWDNAEPLVIRGVAFDPGGSLEPSEAGRNSVVTQPTIYDPSYADVKAGDQIIIGQAKYEVDGSPAEWRSPFTGWSPGQVIKLKTVEG